MKSGLLLSAAALVFAVPCIAAAPYALHLNLQSDPPAPARPAIATATPAPAVVAAAPPQQAVQPAKAAAADSDTAVVAYKGLGFVYVPQNSSEREALLKRKLEAEQLSNMTPEQQEAFHKMQAEKLATGAQDLVLGIKRKVEMEQFANMTPEQKEALLKMQQEEMAVRARRLAELSKAAKITIQQAIDIALRENPGTVMESSLMGERRAITRQADGSPAETSIGTPNPLYRVVIISGDDNDPKRTIVLVNAVDGTIVRSVVE